MDQARYNSLMEKVASKIDAATGITEAAFRGNSHLPKPNNPVLPNAQVALHSAQANAPHVANRGPARENSVISRVIDLLRGDTLNEARGSKDDILSALKSQGRAADAKAVEDMISSERNKVYGARAGAGALGVGALAGLGLGARALARRSGGGLSRNAKIGIGAGLGGAGLAGLLAANSGSSR